MTTQDTRFGARFSDMTASTFYGSNTGNLAAYTPGASPINTGMLADIGRATIWAAEAQDSPYAKFMRSPLARGDSVLTGRFSQSSSGAYDPDAGDDVLFSTSHRPSMISTVATKNFSRQVQVEVNDRLMKQYAQTEEMIGEATAAIAANLNTCFLDDMYTAAVEYFSGSTHGAQASQMTVMGKGKTESGFADELVENMWDVVNNKFAFKSTAYNADSYNTKAKDVTIVMDKNYAFKGFNQLYSETFNPEYLRIGADIVYVDSFATTAGKPSSSGDLICQIVDNRAFDITPMPEGIVASSFYNPARLSTQFFQTYEMAFGHNKSFDCVYIFAKA